MTLKTEQIHLNYIYYALKSLKLEKTLRTN